MSLKRVEDWPKRLGAYLQTSAAMPFAWGSHDCALFTCGGIQAESGVDLAAPFRGTYSDAGSAAIAIRNFAGGDLEQLVEKVLAPHAIREVRPLLAQRGDAVVFDTDLGPTLGIVSLDGMRVVSVAPAGRILIPLRACRRAWRIS